MAISLADRMCLFDVHLNCWKRVIVRTMPEMLTELDKPTDLRVYTIAQASAEDVFFFFAVVVVAVSLLLLLLLLLLLFLLLSRQGSTALDDIHGEAMDR